MQREEITIETADGSMPCHVFRPSGEGAWPAVIYFMDGMGIRPSLLGSAERIAREGYFVVVPNVYYRSPNFREIDSSTIQDDPAQQAKVMEMVATVTNEAIGRDTQSMLDFIDERRDVQGKNVGCVGYCLGGRLVLYAAGVHPERITAAAAIHGASMATDDPDSAHLLAGQMRARLYIGVAEFDPYIIPGETERLEKALADADASYQLEHYDGCHHGFALVGAHGYDESADDLHRRRVFEIFSDRLGQ